MVRRGLITIGVAVQAETFSDSPSPYSTSTTSTPSVNSSSKSTIFLPPTRDGTQQTLKITFAYNKETNLPEILVNLDGEQGQDKYLELKELCSSEGQSVYSNFNSTNRQPKELQVYRFDQIEMDSQDQNCSQIIEVPAITYPQESGPNDEDEDNETKAESEERDMKQRGQDEIDISGKEKATEHPSRQSKQESTSSGENSNRSSSKRNKSQKGKDPQDHEHWRNSTPNKTDRNGKESKTSTKSNGKSRERKQKSKFQNAENTSRFSPLRNISSPTKEISDKSKIPVIHSSATGFMSCDYYRQKWLQEGGCTDYPGAHWNNHYTSSIQKTAGQKVVDKLSIQQKHLEEQAAAQRKRTEFVFHSELGFCEVPDKIPLRKKQTRLEPLASLPKCY